MQEENTTHSIPCSVNSKEQINIDIIYEKEDNFSVAFEYYLSSMCLEFDTKTKSYFTSGLIAQKHFKHFDLIAKCDNIFYVRQTWCENIIIPPTSISTFKNLCVPLGGRIFNMVVRIKIIGQFGRIIRFLI